jgi:hypothetical protein
VSVINVVVAKCVIATLVAMLMSVCVDTVCI